MAQSDVVSNGNGDVECLGVVEPLLHAGPERMAAVLRLDQGQRNVWPVVEDVVCALGLALGVDLAPDDQAPSGEGGLLPDLRVQVPAC